MKANTTSATGDEFIVFHHTILADDLILGASDTERLRGIGAQDWDICPHACGSSDYSAGLLHAHYRRCANDARRRAFDALPDFGTQRGTALDFHPVGVTFQVERERGIPAAWR